MSDIVQHPWRFYLDDMIAFAEKALAYTAGFGQADFVANELHYDATLSLLAKQRHESRQIYAMHIPKFHGGAS